MDLCMRCWDVVLATGDAAFPCLLAMELLKTQRFALLTSDATQMPETLSLIKVEDEAATDALLRAALASYNATPGSLLDSLQLKGAKNKPGTWRDIPTRSSSMPWSSLHVAYCSHETFVVVAE